MNRAASHPSVKAARSLHAEVKRKTKAYRAFKGPKAKKGDVFVLASTSQYTSANYAVTESTHYCFAFVAKVSREGVVLEWTKHGMQGSHPIDKTCDQVMLISDPEKQGAARDLYTHKLDNFFMSVDRIKSMILDRIEALR